MIFLGKMEGYTSELGLMHWRRPHRVSQQLGKRAGKRPSETKVKITIKNKNEEQRAQELSVVAHRVEQNKHNKTMHTEKKQ